MKWSKNYEVLKCKMSTSGNRNTHTIDLEEVGF